MTDINNNFPQENSDEINIVEVAQTLLRQKFLVLGITFLTTFSGITYSLFQKEVWQGSFNIVVKDQNKSRKEVSSNNLISSALDLKSDNETQRLILSSPLILRPVYKYVKSYYQNNGLNIKGMSFKSWIKKELDIKFEQGTNVLEIKYKNSDKELILKVLNTISEKYKNYSRLDRDKSLNKTINYLSSQKETLKTKYQSSQGELNKFSIKNGLGSIDGFIGLGQPKSNSINIESSNNQNNSQFKNNSNNKSTSAGQRYSNQFQILKEYEAQYINLSSKLKPESNVLKSLKLKIDNLKNSLKRPNEILIKYRQLTQNALRDETLLNQVESNLEIAKLEKIKKPDAWIIISEPSINNQRISPKRSQITLISFLSSFILASLLAVIKEKNSKFLYKLKDIKYIMGINPDEIVYDSNNELSILAVKDLISKDKNIKSDEKIGIINYQSETENNLIDSLIAKKILNIKLLDFSEENEIKKLSTIIIFTRENILTKEDYSFLKKYFSIFSNKNLKWVFQLKRY